VDEPVDDPVLFWLVDPLVDAPPLCVDDELDDIPPPPPPVVLLHALAPRMHAATAIVATPIQDNCEYFMRKPFAGPRLGEPTNPFSDRRKSHGRRAKSTATAVLPSSVDREPAPVGAKRWHENR
jgi:hypothetical protein